ncbi:MAG: amidase [Terriglobia bacterium]
MATITELAWLDGTAQAELVRRGEVTPIELVDSAIERIERLNPKLNAVVTPLYEEARRQAAEAGKSPDAIYCGVPYLLKDLLAEYAGAPLTSGCSFLRRFVPPHDSELVSRLKRAGLIILGKTNTPEFGLLPVTEPRLFGPARNPWNLERTPGGSSGGSCAAVASGMVSMAHANDSGGSIRIPSSCCGLFGLKPTRGRITLGPDVGDLMGGLAAEHAVTRSVRDSAALLDATLGPMPGDPYFAELPARPYVEEVKRAPGRLRIALITASPVGTPIHPDCIRAAQDAARLCASLGHEVTEDALKLDGRCFVESFMTVWAAGCAAGMDGWARATGRALTEDEFEPFTWSFYQIGREIRASAYTLALAQLQGLARALARFMESYDVALTPTLGAPPLPIGSLNSPPLSLLEAQQRMTAFVPFTPIANVTGQPAMSVPLFWNAEGLPIGVQFMARYGDEAMLFRLAAQLETERPWAGRRPPITAQNRVFHL